LCKLLNAAFRGFCARQFKVDLEILSQNIVKTSLRQNFAQNPLRVVENFFGRKFGRQNCVIVVFEVLLQVFFIIFVQNPQRVVLSALSNLHTRRGDGNTLARSLVSDCQIHG
jgi:hypothetical protein